MTKLRVAVIQAGSSLFDTPETLDRMEAYCEAAAAQGIDLAVFPEAYIGGYPKGLAFGAVLGSRFPEGRDDYLRYWKSAIVVPGLETERIGSFAQRMTAYLVVGVIERDGATLYCTALFFGPDGTLLGKHRKLMPTGTERLVWGQGDGSTIPVFSTEIGRLGAAICWENYMPDLRQSMYARGINLWCAPTVDERDIWQASMRHIAYEGRTFVLSACQFMTRADAPENYVCHQGNNPETVLIRGGSIIVSPLGEIIAGPVYDREAILTADIDLEDIIRAKYDLDVVGHYARPDIFSLRVNDVPQNPVSFSEQAQPVSGSDQSE
ncbi:MAG: carbon-nitrogen hydrolase family protein [Gluconobacter potus]|uniref:Carbon-nitrogen hydrolase family protein n=1 Tax=Gluconobacter potus TaxID=2724927 RepID=A0ABR9YRR7_9PROT|nr:MULTISPECIES: carbon-nitrogen hydrolase family protein [Gluconobacter]MBF0866125.1 carbon-nitrogen hydrolase family protein [Gluconobacter sp. R71656]MBF0869188.1 carbon-nitrogen hydrolase family protein [Gluconobacter sp. R75628]MBF0875183.1 carbon-nitrogen hydrolase family protein [Gluconobacter sp. R75629]MBF0884153.1 carbon-nitrogen hydrolase family protein [Gluconobacter potus]